MKVQALKEHILVLQAETQAEVLWMVQAGLEVQAKGTTVEARINLPGSPLVTAKPSRPTVPQRKTILKEAAAATEEAADPKTPVCAVANCPLNHGGKRHYHMSPEGRMKSIANAAKARAKKAGKEVPDPSPPKAQPSGVVSKTSGGVEKNKSGNDATNSPTTPSAGNDVVGTVFTPEPLRLERAVEYRERPKPKPEPEPVPGQDEAILTFQHQPDGRRVAWLPGGKVVLVDQAFKETVLDGEAWLVKLDHFATFAKAYPVKRVHHVAPTQAEPEPVKVEKPERPPDLPKPVTTPPKPAMAKVDPFACPSCGLKRVMLANGSLGHRAQDLPVHNKAAVPA